MTDSDKASEAVFHTHSFRTEHMIFRHLAGFLRKHGRISKGVLARSSSTRLDGLYVSTGLLIMFTSQLSSVYYSFQKSDKPVVTLDPNKFAEKKQQCLHIGGLQAFHPYVTLRNRSGPLVSLSAPRLIYDMTTASGKRKLLNYPPDTKAFLYYSTPPNQPRIAGELRLRVTSSDDPASFHSGSDLLISNDRPWSRPLHVVSKCYTPLYENMRDDQLIPDDLHAILSTFPPLSPRYRRRQLLYTINDTFIIDFSVVYRKFCVITENGLEILQLVKLFAADGPTRSVITEQGAEMLKNPEEFTAKRSTLSSPYTGTYTNDHLSRFYTPSLMNPLGSALVRFERSTLPEHEGTRTIVLRFLKIITPVECVIPLYNGYIVQPKEGELFQRSHRNKLDPKVWSVNIDEKGAMTRGFQLLWGT
jgi:hypothetical protein